MCPRVNSKNCTQDDSDVNAITLYGQCFRRRLVGQRVVSDVSVVCSC